MIDLGRESVNVWAMTRRLFTPNVDSEGKKKLELIFGIIHFERMIVNFHFLSIYFQGKKPKPNPALYTRRLHSDEFHCPSLCSIPGVGINGARVILGGENWKRVI